MTFLIKGAMLLGLLVLSFLVVHKLLPRVFVLMGRMLGFRMQLTPLTEKRVRRFKSIKRGYFCFALITSVFFLSFFFELFVNNKALFVRFEDHRAVRAELDWAEEDDVEARARRAAFGTALETAAKGVDGVAEAAEESNEEVIAVRARFVEGADAKVVSERLLKALAAVDRPAEAKSVQIATEHPVVATQYPAVASWLNFVTKPIQALQGDDPLHWHDSASLRAYGMTGNVEMEYRRYANWVSNPGSLETEADKLIEVKITEDTARLRQILADTAATRGLTYDPTSPLPDHKAAEYAAVRAEAQALRDLKKEIDKGYATIVMPVIPHSADEQLLSLQGSPPFAPFIADYPLLGTDFAGRDVGAQLLYGLRVSLAFGFTVAVLGYMIGIAVGAFMGYFGGWFDILTQRFIEIWSGIPFLYTIMIISANENLTFFKLTGLLIALTGWIGITYTMRGEFYRERARDYTQAASAIGVSSVKIMGKHILPNALVPVVTFLPFAIVAHISTLVSLDFLGYGLPPEIPSWGRLLHEGSQNVRDYPHLVYFPVMAFASTLFCVVLIGEAVREAFDPKKYARLR